MTRRQAKHLADVAALHGPDCSVHFLSSQTLVLDEADCHTVHIESLPWVVGRGGILDEAMENLVLLLHAEASQYLRAFSHQLDAEGLRRKATILQVVDRHASRIGPLPDVDTWAMGTLHSDEQGLWLRDDGGWFSAEVKPEQIHDGLDDRPYLARVQCDAIGRPQGPVLELREPRAEEEGR